LAKDAIKMKLENIKNPQDLIFNDCSDAKENRKAAIKWLKDTNKIDQFIVIDTPDGCRLRVDDTYKILNKK
jgi:hypothetical protein